MARLGNPERKLPPVVHVAGTNGKGSAIAFLRAFLEAAGYRVHVYTSPHLVNFNERIRLAGTLISDEELAALFVECEETVGAESITFFEIVTAAAFLAFSRTPADIVLLETGLGGRLDATNVIEKPALTVLTSISMDHQAYLGDTIEEIVREKAGILKLHVPCVCADLRRSRSVVQHWAERNEAPLIEEGTDFYATKSPGRFVYHEGQWTRRLPLPGLAGHHQIRNAALALACIGRLEGFDVPETALEAGMKAVTWPGRLQRLTEGALADRLPEGWELWLDGGHNLSAAKALSSQARSWRKMPLDMVIGMMRPRKPQAFLKPFMGRVRMLTTLAIPGQKESWGPDLLAEAATRNAIPVQPAEGLTDAIERIVAAADRPGRILVCGSLYLVGAALSKSGEDFYPV